MKRIYLDHNATTPVFPEVIKTMGEVLAHVGNASSVHKEGQQAHGVLERARRIVADFFSHISEHVVFTSGGTEANNLVLAPGHLLNEGKLFISPTEHVSGLFGHRFDEARVVRLEVDHQGRVLPDQLEATLLQDGQERIGEGNMPEKPRFMVSVMAANNETGCVQEIEEITRIAHTYGGLVHCDAVQIAGKTRFDPVFNPTEGKFPDFMTVSAHKLGGPQGVGAVLSRKAGALTKVPLIHGGRQENRQRGGTQNLAGIAGFAKAIEIQAQSDAQNVRHEKVFFKVREEIETGLQALVPDVIIFSKDTKRIGNTLCFAIPGIKADSLLMNFDLEGIAVSMGSACSSGKVKKSHVLDAMGVEDRIAAGAVRVSTGWTNELKDAQIFLQALEKIVKRNRSLQMH